MLKLVCIATLAGILIPTNIFVYGTSDTEYVEQVTSKLETDTLQEDNTDVVGDENEANRVIHSDLANILGIEDNKHAQSMVVNGNLSNLGVSLITGNTVEELLQKYGQTNGISIYDFTDTDKLSITNGVYDLAIEKESYEMVAIQDTVIYSGPNEESTQLNTLKTDEEIHITSVVVNGFALIDDSTDKWVKRNHISTRMDANKHKNGTALLLIENPDINYNGGKIKVTGAERDLLERLVMGEAGAEGYEGAVLVAQTIRDFMLYKGFDSVEAVRTGCKYSGRLTREPNANVKKAVAYVFDEGGYAVRHQIYFFYAFKYTKGKWHETQEFIIQHKGHRFFDYW